MFRTAATQTPTLWPEGLLDGEPDQSSERQWWVIYTRARQEKALARDLLAQEVPFYLPLIAKNNYYRGRRVSFEVPVFAGYLFLCGTEDHRVASLQTNRVSRVLAVADGEGLRGDLCQLRRLIASGAPLTVESRLAPGDRVRIRRGPLAGLEGTVLMRRGETRLLVSVDFLQQGASIAIEDFLLEPLDTPALRRRRRPAAADARRPGSRKRCPGPAGK